MVLKKLCIALSVVSLACADITFTSPAAGASITGSSLTIEWQDSGTPALESYTLFLCAGGNTADSYVCVLRRLGLNSY